MEEGRGGQAQGGKEGVLPQRMYVIRAWSIRRVSAHEADRSLQQPRRRSSSSRPSTTTSRRTSASCTKRWTRSGGRRHRRRRSSCAYKFHSRWRGPRGARCADDAAFLSRQAQVSTGPVLGRSILWNARFSVLRTKPSNAALAVTQTKEA